MVSKLVKTLQCLIKSVPKSLLLWEQLGRRDPQRAVAEANYQALRVFVGWIAVWAVLVHVNRSPRVA